MHKTLIHNVVLQPYLGPQNFEKFNKAAEVLTSEFKTISGLFTRRGLLNFSSLNSHTYPATFSVNLPRVAICATTFAGTNFNLKSHKSQGQYINRKLGHF